MSNFLRIPSNAEAYELADMLRGDAVPMNAPREHLHAVLLRLCEIVANAEAEIEDLKSRVGRTEA